jgi:hypothetical protein
VGTFETTLDLIVDFGSTLTQVGPRRGVFEETMFLLKSRKLDMARCSEYG